MTERERELLAQIAARGVRLGAEARVMVSYDSSVWLMPDNPFIDADALARAGYTVLFEDMYDTDGSMFYVQAFQLAA